MENSAAARDVLSDDRPLTLEEAAAGISAILDLDRGETATDDAPGAAESPTPQPTREADDDATGQDTSDAVAAKPEHGDALQPEDVADAGDAEASTAIDLAKFAKDRGLSFRAFAQQVRVPVKIDGQVEEVTLAEAIAGHSRQQDYQRKTRDLAEERKSFEAERESQDNAYQEQLAQQGRMLAEMRQHLAFVNQVDWDRLNQRDPAAYAGLVCEVQAAKDWLERQQADHQSVIRQQAIETAVAKHAHNAREWDRLMERVPDWRNAETRKRELTAMRSFLLREGIAPAVVDEIKDHRMLGIARKAMLYDQLQAKRPLVEKQVRALPRMVRSGTTRDKAERQGEARRRDIARLRRSGRVEDAASAIERLLA
jgi:hypothetical protein